ncbi:molybdopterin-binding protein [Oceanisphaera sp. W20_SRM_FM3]|uniref:molybdopterin-binding protein n=1 Tax=Oceanisphaera sp. W20_SRM_FM3 TaxID=3240267 RepID=UPI003F982E54
MKLLAGILLLWLAGFAQAGSDPVILSVYGAIELDEGEYQRLDFTLSELQALPQAQIITAHPWSAQAQHYKGVDLTALLKLLFANRQINSLNLEGLNGFSMALEWSKISDFSPILAWQENEKLMSRRNKGPLWLMLPYDQAPKMQQANFLHYMVWQLRTIRVYSEPE